jgi:hypothetical protein
MSTIRHEMAARCPPERIWELLADLESVPRYNPVVRAARIVGSPRRGIGAVRECDLIPRGRVTERVTNWEDGHALGLEIIESDWPIHFMKWVTRVDRHEPGARIIQNLEYRVKFGPVGWVLDRLVMRRTIAGNVEKALLGLIKQAEAS